MRNSGFVIWRTEYTMWNMKKQSRQVRTRAVVVVEPGHQFRMMKTEVWALKPTRIDVGDVATSICRGWLLKN
ncbi:hypothetical protein WN51_02722 [Melipona quadrifasciata]|uniref:Uncharacterized protein n=1 Tax=Melipona quadrifasciata TaxID=166423 RepID=A0A0M9A8M1_9HYME|nr:hypothetical protein WN51_02722 [Melipona quadrifasciata]